MGRPGTYKRKRFSAGPIITHIQDWESRFESRSPAHANNGNHSGAREILSARSGVSARQIGRILAGEYETINLDTADKLCMAMDLHISLVYDDE